MKQRCNNTKIQSKLKHHKRFSVLYSILILICISIWICIWIWILFWIWILGLYLNLDLYLDLIYIFFATDEDEVKAQKSIPKLKQKCRF